jgi:hypothetical protein
MPYSYDGSQKALGIHSDVSILQGLDPVLDAEGPHGLDIVFTQFLEDVLNALDQLHSNDG